jgi:hypothetical protein
VGDVWKLARVGPTTPTQFRMSLAASVDPTDERNSLGSQSICTNGGLVKARLQHVATEAAINIQRGSDWVGGVPRATTRRT